MDTLYFWFIIVTRLLSFLVAKQPMICVERSVALRDVNSRQVWYLPSGHKFASSLLLYVYKYT
jgi:hypothetical protein